MSLQIAGLIAKHGDPIELVDSVPRTASELYRRWTIGPWPASLTRRQRRERRALARYLSYLAAQRKVTKRVITTDDHKRTCFCREVAP